MAYLVIAIFFGLSAGVIGKMKGSSFLIWFMVGFVLPVLGTIAAVLYRDENRVAKRRCPECNNVVAIHDQVCRRCGGDLAFPDEALPQA